MRPLATTEVGPWVRDVLLAPSRSSPVIAITTRPSDGETWIDPDRLAAEVGDKAQVVLMVTGEPTWELSKALPPRLDVYGGAVRIWWPGLGEDSDPYAHRLYFVKHEGQARGVERHLLEAVRRGSAEGPTEGTRDPAGQDTGSGTASAADRPGNGRASPGGAAPRRPRGGADLPPERVRITAVSGSRIEVVTVGPAEAGRMTEAGATDAGGTPPARHGVIRFADVPLAELARCVGPGLELTARPEQEDGDGWQYSVRRLLPQPWDLAAGHLSVGDVVTARVQNTKPFGAFVEVLPQVTGLVHISELDWTFVSDVDSFVLPGQLVPVKVLSMEAGSRKLELSLKRAFGTPPGSAPSLVPGGAPFRWAEDEHREPDDEPDDGSGPAALADELEAAVEDRARLAEANRRLREQVVELKKELRSTQDRLSGIEQRLAGELDPLASERDFLLGVRVSYARQFDEGSRASHPLRPMRVGPAFLESVREIEGIETSKILEVCAQVAAGAAHLLSSREVHQLRDGSRGAGSRTRSRDGAQAWRCALQTHTASARRLHWWSVPGSDGGVVEFAAVGLHDDFDIPE